MAWMKQVNIVQIFLLISAITFGLIFFFTQPIQRDQPTSYILPQNLHDVHHTEGSSTKINRSDHSHTQTQSESYSIVENLHAGALTDQWQATSKTNKKPLILLYHEWHRAKTWWFTLTEKDFESCQHKCQVTISKSDYSKADMVMFEAPRYIKKVEEGKIYLQYFYDWGDWPSERGNQEQVRMFFTREPQLAGLSGEGLAFARYDFNYSTTFHRKADIFYPYGHTEKLAVASNETLPDYGSMKKNLTLWFVSNCHSKRRLEYKNELSNYMQVDMYGKCNLTHGDPCNRNNKCTVKLKSSYKFYLAFENNRCEDYITEKYWKALLAKMVPIVMGPLKSAYEKFSPPHSFIHVDDFVSPKKLADYLHYLDKNNTAYNEYHRWRLTHKVVWKSANCGICRLAHEKPQQVLDITEVWDAKNQCW